jgi:hypothetical protein
MALRSGISLLTMAPSLAQVSKLRKTDLAPGDWVFVKTLRSLYQIRVLENGLYEVSGGWFDRKSLSPAKTGIAGCTWGGTVIHTNVAAACGMCLEFDNRLTTSLIQRVCIVPYSSLN